MKELGVKVLTKIEDLISIIDKPNSPKRKKNKLNGNDISFGQSDGNTDSKVYLKKLSYNYLRRLEKNNNIIKSQIYNQETECTPFKVTNKKTLQILNRKKIKPIYQRLDQIIGHKKNNVENIQRINFMKQIESMKPQRTYTQLNAEQQKKMSMEELQDFRTDVNERNIQRIKKRHLMELNNVKKQVFNGIPEIARGSRSLSKIHMKKNNYSEDVFERLIQDTMDRNERKKQFVKEIQQQQGGYQPVLCAKSRILASRSKSKHSIFTQSVDSLCHSKCKKKIVHQPIASTYKSAIKINKQNPQRSRQIQRTSKHMSKNQQHQKRTTVKNKKSVETNKVAPLKLAERPSNVKVQSNTPKFVGKANENKSTVKKQNNIKVSPSKVNISKQMAKQNPFKLTKR